MAVLRILPQECKLAVKLSSYWIVFDNNKRCEEFINQIEFIKHKEFFLFQS